MSYIQNACETAKQTYFWKKGLLVWDPNPRQSLRDVTESANMTLQSPEIHQMALWNLRWNTTLETKGPTLVTGREKISHICLQKLLTFQNMNYWGVPIGAQQKRIQRGTMGFRVHSLALLSGLRLWRCRGLWCRLQLWLGSGVAVARRLRLRLVP